MQRVAQSWQKWLFRSGPLWPLALCRIIWALAMLLATLHESGLAQLYSHAQYHVPLLAFVQPLDPSVHRHVIELAAVGGFLALLGAFTRLSIVLVVGALGYLFVIDLLLFRNHVYLGVLIGGLLACSPCSNVWSVDAAIRRRVGAHIPLPKIGSLACAQLIKAQVLIVYAYSVLNKLRRPFLDGFVLERELPMALRSSPLRTLLCDARGNFFPAVDGFLHSPTALAASSILVVCAEAFLAIGLPSRRLRTYAIGVGLALHTTIFLSMGIHVFGLLMVSSYVLFLTVPRDSSGPATDCSVRRANV